MANGSPPAHTLTDVLYAVAIPLAGAVGALIRHFWTKRTNAPLTLALAEKTHYEGQRIKADVLGMAYDRIDELTEINDELRDTNRELQRSVDKQEIDMQLRDRDIKKYKAILILNNIKYGDYDHVKS